jgi:beta-xylosidase
MKIKLFHLVSAFTLLGVAIGCTSAPALPSTSAPPTPVPPISPLTELTAAPSPDTWTDDFNGALADGWSWVDEDPARWNLDSVPGTLRIITQGLSLYNADKPKNLLLREAPTGDFEITTKVTFDPQNNFQQAAILILQDEDNFVLLNRGFCSLCLDTGNGIFIDTEVNGEFEVESTFRTSTSLQTTWLKLRKEGTTYTGFYSGNGESWEELGRVENPMSPAKVGLTANNSNYEPDVPQIPADFDSFTVQRITPGE